MYVLDTNAFYYAAGLSQCTYDMEKLRKLIESNDVFISTTSLFEFFIRFGADISLIRKGGEYLSENQIKLATNPINPLPDHFVDDLANITEQQFKTMREEVLKNKIDVESRYTSLLFSVCLFSGFYFTALSDGEEPCKYCFIALESVYKTFTNGIVEVFRDLYTDGYSTDDCENYIRKAFYNLLSFMLEKGIPYIEKAKNVTSDEEFQNPDNWFPAQEYSNLASGIAKKISKTTSTEYLQKIARKYLKSNNDPQLKQHISQIMSLFENKIKLPALLEYCHDLVESILIRGAAFWKNDFLDALILCNIQDSYPIITYDNGVIRRLECRQSEHPKYAESLTIINYLKS